MTKTNAKAAECEIRESKKEYEQAITRMSKLDSFIQKLFEDNVDGKISYEAKEKSANVESFLDIVHRYTDIQELDAEIIRTFIEKVYVYQNEKLWSRDTKKLKIRFNFIGDIEIPSNEKTA